MTDSCVFGIVTPSYNQASFLKQTLESVTSQISQEDFYFVADGGSTDKSVEVLKQFGKRVAWVSQADGGQSAAINTGLEHIRAWAGEHKLDHDKVIFAYINSDDYYLPQALDTVRQIFTSSPDLQWLVGDCQIVNASGKPIQQAVVWYKRWMRFFLSLPLLLVGNPLPQPAAFIRLSAMDLVGGVRQDLRFTMDYALWLKLWQRVGPPVCISQTLAAFRIHTSSKGSQDFRAQFEEQYTVAVASGASWPWLFLQKLHNRMITLVYSYIK